MFFADKLKRYRVSRGFSVHSPFAYYFITRVLRESLPFYCFEREVTNRAERTLFRVVNYFRPESVCLVGSDQALARVRPIIALACPGAAETTNSAEADFVYVAAGASLPAETVPVVYAEAASPDSFADAMTFGNGRTLIAVSRRGLPAQNFRVNF